MPPNIAPYDKDLFLLSKESGAFVGHWDSVLVVDVKLFLRSSQFFFKLVNVGHLHAVHQGQLLQTQDTQKDLICIRVLH